MLLYFFVVGAGFYCDNFHLLESSTHSTHSETPNYKHLHSRRGGRQHKSRQAHHTHKGCHPSPTRQTTQSESSGSFSSQPPSRSAPQYFFLLFLNKRVSFFYIRSTCKFNPLRFNHERGFAGRHVSATLDARAQKRTPPCGGYVFWPRPYDNRG